MENDKMELLKIEYQMCHNGYNSRDQMTQDEFSKLVQTFSIFLTVLLAINIFIKVSLLLHVLCSITIGVAGLLSMVAQLLDIESNSSCKVALRKRCTEIEDTISKERVFQYWKVLENRTKYREEELFKGKSGQVRDREETEGDLFINSSRILIVIWLIIVLNMVIWGRSIEFALK